jgi:hypothetical protein
LKLKILTDFETEEVVDVVASSHLRVGPGNYMGPGLRMGTRAITRERSEFDLTASDLLFEGFTAFPNAYSKWNEEELVIDLYDKRFNDQVRDAQNEYQFGISLSGASSDGRDGTTFEDMNGNAVGEAIPTVYGDFLQTFACPAQAVIDYPLGEDWLFKYADSSNLRDGQDAAQEINGVSFLGVLSFPFTDTDAANAIFTVSAEDVRTSEDNIYCDPRGKNNGTDAASVFSITSGDLMKHPVVVLHDLLRSRLDITADDINTTSFTDVYTDDTTLECRAILLGRDKLIDAIDQLSFEYSLFLHNTEGKFKVINLPLEVSSTDKSITEDDILPGSYQVRLDPNRTYFNAFSSRFCRNHGRLQFQDSLQHDILTKQAEYGFRRELSLDFDWVYRRVDVLDRIGNLLAYFGNPVPVIKFKTGFRGQDLQPMQSVDLTYHAYTNQNCLVRRVENDLQNFQTTVELWPMPTRQFKTYAQTSDTAPASYAAAQSASYAVFHASLEIIDGFNSKFNVDVVDGGTTAYEVDITAGYYDEPSDLASELETKLEAATPHTWTVSYSTSTRQWTISIDDGGGETFEVTDTSTEGLRFAKFTLGIDSSTGQVQATSKTSETVAIFDLDDSERVTEYA